VASSSVDDMRTAVINRCDDNELNLLTRVQHYIVGYCLTLVNGRLVILLYQSGISNPKRK